MQKEMFYCNIISVYNNTMLYIYLYIYLYLYFYMEHKLLRIHTVQYSNIEKYESIGTDEVFTVLYMVYIHNEEVRDPHSDGKHFGHSVQTHERCSSNEQ